MTDRKFKPKKRRSALRASSNGAAAVELALLAPVVMLMILGAIDFGGALFERMRLTNSARAGVQFALQSDANAQDPTGIEQSVLNATGLDPLSVTVAQSQYCECADGTTIVCTATCTGGGPLRRFVNVTVSEQFQTLYPYPGITNPLTLTGQATIRVR